MRDGGTHLIHLCLSLLQTAVAGEVGRLLRGSTLCCRGSTGRGRPMKRAIFLVLGGRYPQKQCKQTTDSPSAGVQREVEIIMK